MGALAPYAAVIAQMAGYPVDHPRLALALEYAEGELTAALGHLEDRTITYSVTPDYPVRIIALPPGEVLTASAPGGQRAPGLWELASPAEPGQTYTFTVRQRWTGENPAILRAAAEIVAHYLSLPEPDAAARWPGLRRALGVLRGAGVVG